MVAQRHGVVVLRVAAPKSSVTGPSAIIARNWATGPGWRQFRGIAAAELRPFRGVVAEPLPSASEGAMSLSQGVSSPSSAWLMPRGQSRSTSTGCPSMGRAVVIDAMQENLDHDLPFRPTGRRSR